MKKLNGKREELSGDGIPYSYNDIALEFGVHYDTVRKKFKKERCGATGGYVSNNILVPDTTGYIMPTKRAEALINNISFYGGGATTNVVVNPPKSLEEKVLDALKQECSISVLADNLGVSDTVIRAVIADISTQGYNIFEHGDYAKISRVAIPTVETFDWHWDGSRVIRIGLVADPHLCSKYQQLTHLNSIYDTFEREGIRRVLNLGDLTEGVNMRRGHEYELFIHGVDEQADYVVDVYPQRNGIITEYITGNHDHTGIKSAGADIGKRIASARKDMKYLGLANAKVNITPNCTIELNHGLDGSSYALSYTLQKFIDALDASDLPNIFLNGHHHKMMYTYYRNIHALECGTFQRQTPWMKGKRLAAHVGGVILTVHVTEEGRVSRFIPEFIPFYKFIEKDY